MGSCAVLVVAVIAACTSSSLRPTASNPADGGVTAMTDAGVITITTDAGVVTITPLGSVARTVASAGGTISLGLASLVVPAGGVSESTPITITATSVQPEGRAPTTIYQFGPEGLTFAVPATVNLPATAGVVHWSQVLSGVTVFTDLPTSLAGGLATAQVTHFSYGFVGTILGPAGGGVAGAIAVCPVGLSNGGQAGDLVCPAGYTPHGTTYVPGWPLEPCCPVALGNGLLCIATGPATICWPDLGPDAGAVICSDASGTCVNLSSDRTNCGTCGNVCPAGQGCSNGTCAAPCGGFSGCGGSAALNGGCPSGTVVCGNCCTDFQVDPNNCGACGNLCALGQSCAAGGCTPQCAGGGVCAPNGYCATSCPAGSAVCGAASSRHEYGPLRGLASGLAKLRRLRPRMRRGPGLQPGNLR